MSVARLIAHEQASTQVQGQPPSYAELRPLPSPLPEAPELPAELLPSTLRPWLCDLAHRMQVPLEMAAIPALVGLSSVLGRKIGIHPKAKDDWLVVPNLWGGIVARPGKMKSPTLAETLRPLRQLAAGAQQEHREALDASGARTDTLKAKESAIKDQLKKAFKAKSDPQSAGLEHELVRVRQELREQETHNQERRYIVNDSTVEKLGELLAHNPWGLLLERDELAGWLRSLERDDRRGDREFFLEAWNGTNAYTYDRIGRGTLHVPALCLSIIGGIQPSKLSRFVADAVEGGYAADGLLQRFQLLVWPEDQRAWTLVDQKPEQSARDRASEVFQRLGRIPCPGVEEPIPALRFSPDAQGLFFEWLSRLEHRLRSDSMGETPAFESHLAKYRSLMPSLALLFHLVEAESTEGPVDLSAARCAADWCEFLEQHARKVYAAELRTDHLAAHALLRKIREGAIVSGMTLREVYNAGWSRLKSQERVHEGLALLTAHGWARLQTLKTGGRPKQILSINPQALEAQS